MKRKKVRYGKTLKINGRLRLHGNGTMTIGDNVRINSCESANPIGGMEHTVISMRNNAPLTIGHNVGMSNVAIFCHKRITIEDNVFLGGGVKIYDTDFHSLDYSLRGKGIDIDVPVSKSIVIKSNAFIGAHSLILKGVTIGKYSIIGAGSVVTKNIPDNEIWAGNPAHFIRKGDVK
ncbi:MAG TPA: acyltransferase [Clostridium sp.]|uniref:acyltransferase n=1 Tax=Clostridium sp. TaxID=1506 RepID=UPI002F933603